MLGKLIGAQKLLGQAQSFAQKALGSGIARQAWNVLKAIPELHRFAGQTRQLIEKYGERTVASLVSCRTPLSTPTQSLVKLLHDGKLAVDNLFHLFLRITLNDGTRLVFEKHGSPSMSKGDGPRNDEQTRAIHVSSGLKLADMIENAIRKTGHRQFFIYDPFRSNCQDFQLALLSGSPQIALTSEDRSWIDQDARKIAENVPAWAKSASAEVIQLFAKLRLL